MATSASIRSKGRLKGWKAWLVILLLLSAFPIGLYVLAPWNFYYGGHFHLIPGWQGMGVIHSKASGGDYSLFVYIEPKIQQYQQSDIQGSAVLCTPKGVRIPMAWIGNFPSHPTADLAGVTINFGAFGNSVKSQFNGDYHPSVGFHGSFGDHQLHLDDDGTIATAFHPDGSVVERNQPSRSNQVERLQFNLKEVSFLSKAPPCGPAHP